MINYSQASAHLAQFTLDEIRDLLELEGVSVSDLNNQQVYETAINCLLDD